MPTKGDKNAYSKGSSLAGVLEMLQEINRAMQKQHQAQQRMLLNLIEQQQVAHKWEMKTLIESRQGGEDSAKPNLLKPMLQKLTVTDNVEHLSFLSTFERITMLQEWPKQLWATQLAGWLSGKALAADAALTLGDAELYDKGKEAILRRYKINKETYCQWFRQDWKRGMSHIENMLIALEITFNNELLVWGFPWKNLSQLNNFCWVSWMISEYGYGRENMSLYTKLPL